MKIVACTASLLLFATQVQPAAPQNVRPPSLDSVVALALDSVPGQATVYYRTVDHERALRLHTLLSDYLAFYREVAGVESQMRVAVLNSQDWARVTNVPYGLPNNSGPGGANLLLAAATPPERVGARNLPRGRMGDLLVIGHEGGHLLAWEVMPAELKAALRDTAEPPAGVMERLTTVGRVPAWYWELVANYFTVLYVARKHPQDREAWVEHLREITAIDQPRFTHLADWFGRVLQATAPDSTPYVFSVEGGLNQGWYQGVVGLTAAHIQEQSGLGLFGHIKHMLGGTATPTTEQIVLQLDSVAPGVTQLLHNLGAGWADSVTESAMHSATVRPVPRAAASEQSHTIVRWLSSPAEVPIYPRSGRPTQSIGRLTRQPPIGLSFDVVGCAFSARSQLDQSRASALDSSSTSSQGNQRAQLHLTSFSRVGAPLRRLARRSVGNVLSNCVWTGGTPLRRAAPGSGAS